MTTALSASERIAMETVPELVVAGQDKEGVAEQPNRLGSLWGWLVGAWTLFASSVELSRELEGASSQRRKELLAWWVDAAIR